MGASRLFRLPYCCFLLRYSLKLLYQWNSLSLPSPPRCAEPSLPDSLSPGPPGAPRVTTDNEGWTRGGRSVARCLFDANEGEPERCRRRCATQPWQRRAVWYLETESVVADTGAAVQLSLAPVLHRGGRRHRQYTVLVGLPGPPMSPSPPGRFIRLDP